MLRVVGTVAAPVEGVVLENVNLLVQCIKSSVISLEGTFAPVKCDELGNYDFNLIEGIYRIYIKYSTATPSIKLGDCGVVEGMPEELNLNNLLTNYTPQVPDWIEDLDQEWNDTWEDFVNDNNTAHASINNSVAMGDAKVVSDMSVYVNEVTGQQGAALREEISAGDAGVYTQSKAYTDNTGNELASQITEVSNSVSTVSQELTALVDSSGNSFNEITDRIETNEANLSSTITAEVESQTGAMQLRIADVIKTNNAEIAQSISVIENALGETQAAWQVVATVGDLTSAIGMTNDGINSEIYMQANALRFVDPSDDSRSTVPIFEIKDGLVSMRSAFINELGATTITTDEVQSSVFDPNTGFKLHSSGYAEFQNIKARGHIEATAGTFAGELKAATGTFGGELKAASGTFSGTLSAADGDFQGTVYAANMVGDVFEGATGGFPDSWGSRDNDSRYNSQRVTYVAQPVDNSQYRQFRIYIPSQPFVRTVRISGEFLCRNTEGSDWLSAVGGYVRLGTSSGGAILYTGAVFSASGTVYNNDYGKYLPSHFQFDIPAYTTSLSIWWRCIDEDKNPYTYLTVLPSGADPETYIGENTFNIEMWRQSDTFTISPN